MKYFDVNWVFDKDEKYLKILAYKRWKKPQKYYDDKINELFFMFILKIYRYMLKSIDYGPEIDNHYL